MRSQVLEQATGGSLPEIKFFNMGELTIAGRKVRALHHGMSGAPGWSCSARGRTETTSRPRSSRRAGSSGSGRSAPGSTRPTRSNRAGYRARCRRSSPARRCRPTGSGCRRTGTKATGSLGGSFYSDDIKDYYLTPHELGYWPFVKFDHEFIGREALERIADEPKRKKVTLAWNGEDVARAMGTLFEKGDPAKYIDLPLVQLLDLAIRQGAERRQDGRRLDVLRLQLQRALDALAGDGRRRTSSWAPR